MLQVLRRIWNRPLSAIVCPLVILGVAFTIYRLFPYVSATQDLDRVELMLWQQLDPGKISSRLTEIELAELTAEMDAEQAVRFRQDLEHKRKNLRQEVRRMAREIVNQKRKREPERPPEKISTETNMPSVGMIGEIVSEQPPEIRSLGEQRRRLEWERRRTLVQERRELQRERRRKQRGK